MIVDDEPLARRTVRSLLRVIPQVEIVAESSNGKDALELIRRLDPDLLFLDVQMPEMNGFDLLEQMQSDHLPAVIFVTAYDRYAIQAFDVHALDYLLKPFDDERFEAAVLRAIERIRLDHDHQLSRKLLALLGDYKANPNPEKKELERIPVKSHGRISFIHVDEIEWIEAADQYVLIHLKQESHLIRESMNQMETKLPAKVFIRIHRSTMVNLQKIGELRSNKQGETNVVLLDGTSLKVSRNRRMPLQEALLTTGTSA